MKGMAQGSGALRCADYMVHTGVLAFPGLEHVWLLRRRIPVRGSSGAGRTKVADYVIGSYTRLIAIKDVTLGFARDDGQRVGEGGDWHVHHLVEGSVYADVHFEDVPYDWMYENVLPCILVSKKEHLPYFHGVSRGRESRELYGLLNGATGGGSPSERAKAAWGKYHRARRERDAKTLEELRGRVLARAEMLDNLHHFNEGLRAITANVFRRALQRLDEPAH